MMIMNSSIEINFLEQFLHFINHDLMLVDSRNYLIDIINRINLKI